MKKFIYLFLFFTAFTNAQTTDTTSVKMEWYFGGGAIINPDYNINSNLRDAGVKRIADVSPAFLIGWNATFSNRFSLEMELGFSGLQNKKKDGSQFLQVPASARFQYALIKSDRVTLSAGANFSVVASDLSIFDSNTVIDMNDLRPANNTGYVRLTNTSYFLGPVAQLKLTDAGKTFLTFTAGYDFGISNSKWKSDYVKIANPVRENGNRIFINLSIPFAVGFSK